MSEEIIKNLTTELANTKGQLNGIASQLEAHKGMLNEMITGSLNLRTTLVQFQKANQEMNHKFNESTKQINTLTQQLADANAKIAELTKPVVEAPAEAA